MRVSLSSSIAACWRGSCTLSSLRSWSRSRSVHSWAQFLPTAESSPGLPGAAWKLLVGRQRPAPNSGKLRISLGYLALFLLLVILLVLFNVISKIFYIEFISLPFSPFSLPLVGGQGLIESIHHSVYCCPALHGDNRLSLIFTMFMVYFHWSFLFILIISQNQSVIQIKFLMLMWWIVPLLALWPSIGSSPTWRPCPRLCKAAMRG